MNKVNWTIVAVFGIVLLCAFLIGISVLGGFGGYGGYGRGWGMMGGWFNPSGGQMTVTPDQARQDAQAYLDQAMPGVKVGNDITPFYGYYTLHTYTGDKVSGMLSVNGYTGQVWYHTWHGAFVAMKELGD